MTPQQVSTDVTGFRAVFDHGQFEGACEVSTKNGEAERRFNWRQTGDVSVSELAETIAEQIIQFVHQVRVTCCLVEGVYRSPTGPYGLRRQWLAVEWLAGALWKRLKHGDLIPFRQNFPVWGWYSIWPAGRKELSGEHWCHCEFMPHLKRGATGNPDGPTATGLIAPVGSVPSTGEGHRRLALLMSLMTCPIRDSGVSVDEMDRLEALAIELQRDLAKIGDRPPNDLIDHKEAAGIPRCAPKTIEDWIKKGKLRSWGPDKLVSRKEVEEKHASGKLYERKPRPKNSQR